MISGEDGNDYLDGGVGGCCDFPSAAVLSGRERRYVVHGFRPRVYVRWAGERNLHGLDGDDVLRDGGNDIVHGGGGLDFLSGGSGSDMLHGFPGDDTLVSLDGEGGKQHGRRE